MAPFSRFDLTGKTAVVTGGSMGLGYAMAHALVEAGAKVMITGRRESELAKAASALERDSRVGPIQTFSSDLQTRDGTEALTEHAIAVLGGPDIFIGNAGWMFEQRLEDIDYKTIDDCLQLNLVSNITLTQAFLPYMEKRGWGRFIYSSSTSSLLATQRPNYMYGVTKAGLNSFARSVACIHGRNGITANALIIAVTNTPLVKDAISGLSGAYGPDAAQAVIDTFTSVTALGRFAEPEELEGLIQLLASDAGSYITGASIPIDGGTTMMLTPDAPWQHFDDEQQPAEPAAVSV